MRLLLSLIALVALAYPVRASHLETHLVFGVPTVVSVPDAADMFVHSGFYGLSAAGFFPSASATDVAGGCRGAVASASVGVGAGLAPASATAITQRFGPFGRLRSQTIAQASGGIGGARAVASAGRRH
jgi:hypothetical protein